MNNNLIYQGSKLVTLPAISLSYSIPHYLGNYLSKVGNKYHK
jgi:hypothetical protein